MLTLYFAPGSSSMAVHISLHEVGAPLEARPLSFAQHEQQGSEYLALNPEGKVPTLLIDGRPLTEVAAILFFLAKRYPQAALLPGDDVEAEAQVLRDRARPRREGPPSGERRRHAGARRASGGRVRAWRAGGRRPRSGAARAPVPIAVRRGRRASGANAPARCPPSLRR